MATLTETITRELLEALDDPGGLDRLLQRYQGSKGPLYKALAYALDSAEEQLREAQGQLGHVSLAHEAAAADTERLDQQRANVQAELDELETRRAAAEEQLEALGPTLRLAKDMERQGFGETQLARLAELLAGVAADQGLPPEEGVAQFFETVQRYEQVVSLDLEAKAAERRASQARAEGELSETRAKEREAHSAARTSTIDLVERLLADGIREADLPRWAAIVKKAGVTPAELEKSVKQYGVLARALSAGREELTVLKRQVSNQRSRLASLRRDEEQTTASLAAISGAAVSQIERLAARALAELEALAAQTAQYGEIQRRAGELHQELEVARIIVTLEPDAWVALPRPVVQRLVLGLIYWAQGSDHNRTVDQPPRIREAWRQSMWTASLSLENILVWALAGCYSEAQLASLGAQPR